MNPKKIEIDGKRFSNLKEFYDEIERCLTSGLDWNIGRNLDAFNDILKGGFGVHKYEEDIELSWKNSERSRLELGFKETKNYLQEKMKNCYPLNRKEVRTELELANKEKGKIIFDTIIEIIKEHQHIDLKMK